MAGRVERAIFATASENSDYEPFMSIEIALANIPKQGQDKSSFIRFLTACDLEHEALKCYWSSQQ